MTAFILAQGNVETGFHFIGPFSTPKAAEEWVLKWGDSDRSTYRILPIENPDGDPC